MSGSIEGLQSQIYQYTLAVRGETGITYSILDTPVTHVGLRFILISRKHGGDMRYLSILLNKLHLEGNINEYFDLYVTPGLENSVLQILTPDLMATLIDHYEDYSLELSPIKLYYYRATTYSTDPAETINAMLGQIKPLQPRLLRVIHGIKSQSRSCLQVYPRARLV